MAAVPDFVTGRKSSIGTTAVQLTTAVTHANRGVQIVADASNSSTVYVGYQQLLPMLPIAPMAFHCLPVKA